MTFDITPYKNCLAHKHGLYISNEVKPYKPCCWFKGGVDAASFDEYQTELAQLDIEHGCQHCIKQEQNGATWTHRKLFKEPTELVLGVCFDNICNIKCITCSPDHSSQHIAEWSKLGKFEKFNLDKKRFTRMMAGGPEKLKMVESTILSNQFDTLRLEIFGGEPLINPVVINFIKWLAEQGYAPKTNLVITTNGTTSLSVVSDYIKDFNQVTVQFSVDGTGEVFDTMRFGAGFESAETHIKEFQLLSQQYPHFKYGFNYTLSWLNVDGFESFYNWVANNFLDCQSLHLTKLTGPRGYVVDLMPDEFLAEFINQGQALPVPVDAYGLPRQEFIQIKKLYAESLTLIRETDVNLFLKNKSLVNVTIAELDALFALRKCSADSLPMVKRIVSYYDTVLPPYELGETIENYCVGTEQWAKVSDGVGGYTEVLVDKESYHCGWRPPVLERGFLVDNFCKGFDQWGKFADGGGGFYEELIMENCMSCGFEYPKLERGFLVEVFCKEYEQWHRYADGAGGHYDELVEENSYGCGFRHPPMERGFLVEVYCEGNDEWGKYADGQYGFYTELRFKDSMYCLLKNNKSQEE